MDKFQNQGARPKNGGYRHARGNRRHAGLQRDTLQGYRSDGTTPTPRFHPISLGKLKSYMERDDPNEVLQCLANERSGFSERLKVEDASYQNVKIVLDVTQMALISTYAPQTTSSLLKMLSESDFMAKSVPQYLTRLLESQTFSGSCIPLLHNLMTILKKIAKHLPTSSMTMISFIIPQLRVLFDRFAGDIDPDIIEAANAIEKNQNAVLEAIKDRTIKQDKDHAQYEAPPDDFRDIAILPTQEDVLINEEPFLRKNNVFGSYISADDYLDTQFRLLREDCIQPLRHGISELKGYLSHGQKIDHRHLDVKVYSDVKIEYPIGTSKGVAFRVQFNTKGLQRINWEKTKRLLTGALVCLSRDNFASVLVGVIADHDARSLQNGVVDVFFEGQYLQALDLNPTHVYMMVESSAYFEAYRHNLQGLKDIATENLPFSKYILNQETGNVDSPQYIRGNDSVYNFSCVIQPSYHNNPIRKAVPFLSKRQPTKILDRKTWPTRDEMGLDDSQYKAVQTALMKEFSVIQGPPGTGKTYIGLMIAKILLRNKENWNQTKAPILVVCYTNHALDQFLGGILAFKDVDDSIIRVGGRCDSPEMDACLLKNIKKDRKVHVLNSAKAEIFQQMNELTQNLKRLSTFIRSLSEGIFHENFLQLVMLPEHYCSLLGTAHEINSAAQQSSSSNAHDYRSMSAMVTWLLNGIPNLSAANETESNGNITHEDNERQEEEPVDEDLNMERIYNFEVIDEIQSMIKDIDENAMTYREHALTANELHGLMKISHKGQKRKDKDGFTKVKSSVSDNTRVKFKRVLDNLSKNEAMTSKEANAVVDIWKLSERNKWRLYHYWSQMYLMLKQQGSRRMYQEYSRLAERLNEIHEEEDFRILQNATVIGMTTTGAAKNRRLLQRIQPRIVIVEEAAEVLEAHIITSLSPYCQQLILIGDHQQLKPNPSVYLLAKKYQLDVSLFERMVKNDMHCDQLLIQHRMRPEIASLIVPHIYKEVQNHESVLKYDNVRGIASNLYFLHHDEKESNEDDTKSRSNLHEAEMCGALALYLQKQGYETSQITILTMYTGQMFLIRKHMPPPLERKSWVEKIEDGTLKYPPRVRVTPVDNYQGEENDIIILSLVRSNDEGKIGFLKIANRVCVALSRAKKGFYVIGNMSMLEDSSTLWRAILGMLRSRGQLVTSVPLCCQNHKDRKTEIVNAKDFRNVPDGGCKEKCDARLDCGHTCTRFCHPYDQDHVEFVCKKPCQRKCKAGHLCSKKCFQSCGACKVIVEKEIPKCGHVINMQCHQDPENYNCTVPCQKELACGHVCQESCGSFCTERCQKNVVKALPDCGHERQMTCYDAKFLSIRKLPCFEKCTKSLPCGHNCKENCEEICTEKCEEIVKDRTWPCGHKWTTYCYHNEQNFPCRWRVTKQLPKCSHSKEMFCCEDAAEVKCRERCDKMLECGHKCTHKCFDQCTQECHVIVKDKKWPCGHRLTVKCFQNPDNFTCMTPVTKMLQCGHNANLRCSDDVQEAKCDKFVVKNLMCGHSAEMKCCEDTNAYRCDEMVVKDLPCKHTIVSKCGTEEIDYKCKAPVQKLLPCGHEVTVQCHKRDLDILCTKKVLKKFECGHELNMKCSDDDTYCKKVVKVHCSQKHQSDIECYRKEELQCQKTCNMKLRCGHECKQLCFECTQNGHHPICTKPCKRKQPCGHRCQHICGEPCLPCQEKCQLRCPHGQCTGFCGEPCHPCEKPCTRQCIHARCSKKCWEDCSCQPCLEPCPETLLCGHACLGLCGQPCPTVCKFCNKVDVQMMMSVQGFKIDRDTRFVLLEGCEHIIELSVLTSWIEKQAVQQDLQQMTCPLCPKFLTSCNIHADLIKERRQQIENVKSKLMMEWLCIKALDEAKNHANFQKLRKNILKIFCSLDTEDAAFKFVQFAVLLDRVNRKDVISDGALRKKLQLFKSDDEECILPSAVDNLDRYWDKGLKQLLHQLQITYMKLCIELFIKKHFNERGIERSGNLIYPVGMLSIDTLPIDIHHLERTKPDEVLQRADEICGRLVGWVPDEGVKKEVLFPGLVKKAMFGLSWLAHPEGSWKKCSKGHAYFSENSSCSVCLGFQVEIKMRKNHVILKNLFGDQVKPVAKAKNIFHLGALDIGRIRKQVETDFHSKQHYQQGAIADKRLHATAHGRDWRSSPGQDRGEKRGRGRGLNETLFRGSKFSYSMGALDGVRTASQEGAQDIQFRAGGFGRGRCRDDEVLPVHGLGMESSDIQFRVGGFGRGRNRDEHLPVDSFGMARQDHIPDSQRGYNRGRPNNRRQRSGGRQGSSGGGRGGGRGQEMNMNRESGPSARDNDRGGRGRGRRARRGGRGGGR